MNIKIVTIPNMISPSDWEPLTQLGEVTYVEKAHLSESELLNEIIGTEYLLLNYDVIKSLSEDFYKTVKEQEYPLKAISADITAMAWANPAFAQTYGVKLLNIPNYSTLSVAEFTLTSLQMMIKKMHLVIDDKLHGREPEPRENDVFEGKTLGIVGLGHIGETVAKLAQGIGMNVIAWNRTPKSVTGITMVDSLEDLFTTADHVSIHLKTTPESQQLVTKELLMSMKGGYLINQADRTLVNNDDILAAIEAGKLGGYSASDAAVKDHPLSQRAEVLSFPAQAWFTQHSLQKLREIWVQNVLLAEKGEFPNLVAA